MRRLANYRPDSSDAGRVLLGSLSTYSRHEAISRSIVLIDLPDLSKLNLVSYVAHLGDISLEEAIERYPSAAGDISEDFQGYTLKKEGGIQPEFRTVDPDDTSKVG